MLCTRLNKLIRRTRCCYDFVRQHNIYYLIYWIHPVKYNAGNVSFTEIHGCVSDRTLSALYSWKVTACAQHSDFCKCKNKGTSNGTAIGVLCIRTARLDCRIFSYRPVDLIGTISYIGLVMHTAHGHYQVKKYTVYICINKISRSNFNFGWKCGRFTRNIPYESLVIFSCKNKVCVIFGCQKYCEVKHFL